MSEIKKPEILSQRKRHLCNEFYKRLKSRLCIRSDLDKEFRINERISRDTITEVGHRFPVITPGKGYKIADDSPEDTLEEIHKIRDYESREREFNKSKAVLLADVERKMKKAGIVTLAEFERFLKDKAGGE